MIESNQSATEFGGRCGARLREAREAAGLSIESVAAQLKMPARVVRSLDAIHLAAARRLGDQVGKVVTYDRRMFEAATLLGLTAAAPGAESPA